MGGRQGFDSAGSIDRIKKKGRNIKKESIRENTRRGVNKDVKTDDKKKRLSKKSYVLKV